MSKRKGGFVVEILASAEINASRKCSLSGFGSSSSEARCDELRVCAVTCGSVRCRTPASVDVQHSAKLSLRASGFEVARACPIGSEGSAQAPSGVWTGTGDAALA